MARTHTHTNRKNFFDCSTRFLIAVWYGLESHYLMFQVSGHNIWLFKNQRKPVTQIKLQTFLWHCYILVEEVMVVVGDRLFCQFSSWFEGEGCLSHCNNTEPWRLRSLSTDIDFALVLCTLLNRTLSLTRSQGNRILKKICLQNIIKMKLWEVESIHTCMSLLCVPTQLVWVL